MNLFCFLKACRPLGPKGSTEAVSFTFSEWDAACGLAVDHRLSILNRGSPQSTSFVGAPPPAVPYPWDKFFLWSQGQWLSSSPPFQQPLHTAVQNFAVAYGKAACALPQATGRRPQPTHERREQKPFRFQTQGSSLDIHFKSCSLPQGDSLTPMQTGPLPLAIVSVLPAYFLFWPPQLRLALYGPHSTPPCQPLTRTHPFSP